MVNCGFCRPEVENVRAAMIKIAIDLFHEGHIDEKTSLNRCDAGKLDELVAPCV